MKYLREWLRVLAATATLLVLCRCSMADDRPNLILIFSDDHGWADLGAQGIRDDIRTPNLDALAAKGLRATNGYVTAPQCVPSRSGLITGRYQNRFGVESNGMPLTGFDEQTTLATRLKNAGYATGMTGKWHLGELAEIPTHGFDDVFANVGAGRSSWATFDLAGNTIPASEVTHGEYHLDANSAAACAFIKRHRAQPFFFYVAYRAPHTPLDAPEKYTSRFPAEMPARRRQALAMISAIDDGVGRIVETLQQVQLEQRTLIVFMGDNGAPLKIHKMDSPLNGDAGGWDGSLNEPMNGEKGMLSEGGIRVPWLACWPSVIPAGQVYEHPVISLDVAATITALAGVEVPAGELDGVNLLPYFRGDRTDAPHEALTWRWISQSAIRAGNWKLLRGGDREYLFDLQADPGEKHNLAAEHPEVAARLRTRLSGWCDELQPPGLATGPMAATWTQYFDHYLEGRLQPPPSPSDLSGSEDRSRLRGWLGRGIQLTVADHVLQLRAENGTEKANRRGFITHSDIKLAGPATARVTLKCAAGPVSIAWRTDKEKDFITANRAAAQATDNPDWQTVELSLPSTEQIVHVRLEFPAGDVDIQSIDMRSPSGKTVFLWK